MSFITPRQAEEAWTAAQENVREEVAAMMEVAGENRALLLRVSSLSVVLASLTDVHKACMEMAREEGAQQAREATEEKALQEVGEVVSRFRPRLQEFCKRVREYLGPESIEEPILVHEIRKDIQEIPRGWV
jgi:uncharacterized protein YigA (DUF484 family)